MCTQTLPCEQKYGFISLVTRAPRPFFQLPASQKSCNLQSQSTLLSQPVLIVCLSSCPCQCTSSSSDCVQFAGFPMMTAESSGKYTLVTGGVEICFLCPTHHKDCCRISCLQRVACSHSVWILYCWEVNRSTHTEIFAENYACDWPQVWNKEGPGTDKALVDEWLRHS